MANRGSKETKTDHRGQLLKTTQLEWWVGRRWSGNGERQQENWYITTNHVTRPLNTPLFQGKTHTRRLNRLDKPAVQLSLTMSSPGLQLSTRSPVRMTSLYRGSLPAATLLGLS